MKNLINYERKINWFLFIMLLSITLTCAFFVFKLIYKTYFPIYDVCFTPTENCADKIISVIDDSNKSIYVMAYGFTSVPITDSLLRAKARGVEVDVILDKSNAGVKKTIPITFSDNKIPVYIDYRPPIAHNKVMIIDNNIVITGSYNFTGNAQKNAENVIFIRNLNKVKHLYMNNWNHRQQQSMSFQKYINYKKKE
jgi:phosphatidylserine/phosphatidylglycerophosphate/cardiolipin synthase-like enzyme